MAYWSFVDPSIMVSVFTAILIVACPCALALASPFALGSAQRIFGNNQFYIKNTETVEALARVDTIVFDKTGTLTNSSSPNVMYDGTNFSDDEREKIKSLVRHSTHALSRQIFSSLDCTSERIVHEYLEIPGKGIQGRVDGSMIRIGSGTWLAAKEKVNVESHDLSSVFVEIEGELKGIFRIPNMYRKGLQLLIEKIRDLFSFIILSGDSNREEKNLRSIFGPNVNMMFDQSPEQKMQFIRARQKIGKRVLMIGDGLNDAGALKAAHVGISISEDINTFSPACDAILSAEQFHSFDKLMKFARSSYRIVIASFIISITYNIIGLSFAVTGLLSPLVSAILMPVSSVTVVAFTTMTTRLRARQIGLR